MRDPIHHHQGVERNGARGERPMRVDVSIGCRSVAEAVEFYVSELELFVFAYDFGMDNVLIRYVHNAQFCLLLVPPGQAPSGGPAPIFSLEVRDCAREHRRVEGVRFTRGGISGSLFEYPLGRHFTMTDPSDNRFLISDWRPTVR